MPSMADTSAVGPAPTVTDGAVTQIGHAVAVTGGAHGFRARPRRRCSTTMDLDAGGSPDLSAADVSALGDVDGDVETTAAASGRIDDFFGKAGIGGPSAPIVDRTSRPPTG